MHSDCHSVRKVHGSQYGEKPKGRHISIELQAEIFINGNSGERSLCRRFRQENEMSTYLNIFGCDNDGQVNIDVDVCISQQLSLFRQSVPKAGNGLIETMRGISMQNSNRPDSITDCIDIIEIDNKSSGQKCSLDQIK